MEVVLFCEKKNKRMLNSKRQVTTWKQAGNTWRTDAILLFFVKIWKNLAQSGKITRLNVFSNWITSCRSLILAFHNILTQKCMIHHGNWIRAVVNIKAREIFHKSRKVCCVKRWYKRWRKRRKMKEIKKWNGCYQSNFAQSLPLAAREEKLKSFNSGK